MSLPIAYTAPVCVNPVSETLPETLAGFGAENIPSQPVVVMTVPLSEKLAEFFPSSLYTVTVPLDAPNSAQVELESAKVSDPVATIGSP